MDGGTVQLRVFACRVFEWSRAIARFRMWWILTVVCGNPAEGLVSAWRGLGLRRCMVVASISVFICR
eukprot:11633034-Alexandrium_andersonii.AAC.1